MNKRLFVPWLAAAFLLSSAFAVYPTGRNGEEPSISAKFITSISADGSGSVTEEILISKAALDWIRSQGAVNIPEDQECSTFLLGLEELVSWNREKIGDDTLCMAKQPFADLGGLRTLMSKFYQTSSFERLEISGGRLYYNLVWPVESAGESDAAVPLTSEAYWILVLPGDAVSTNADTTEGRTLTWDISHLTTTTHFTAESRIGGDSPDLEPAWIVAGGAVLLLCCVLLSAGAAALFFLIRRNRPPSVPAR
jgi:hypothetical protein